MKLSRRAVAKGSLSIPVALMQMRSGLLQAANTYEDDAGVASGSPRENSVILWTRVPGQFRAGVRDGDEIKVSWEVATSDRFAANQIVATGQISTSSASDFTVKPHVTGLAAFTTYYYRFTTVAGYRSVVGRTKTAPAAGTNPQSVKFGIVACQRFSAGYYTAYGHLAKENIDYVVHLGDHIYEVESGRVRTNDPLTGAVAKSLSDFRLKYRYYLSDPSYREARRKFAWIDLWDDHEVVDNYTGLDLWTSDRSRISGGYQAFCEYMPTPAKPFDGVGTAPEVRLYDRYPFGNLVDLYLLDQRQYRTPCACTRDFMSPGCGTLNSPTNTLLGATQKQWFKQGLSASSAKWQFVLSEVVFAKFKMPARNVNELRGESVEFDTYEKAADNLWFNLDAWDGYPAERTELLKYFADSRIDNVVFLSGDVHSAYNSKLYANEGDAKPAALEIVTSPISSAPLQRGLQRTLGDRATQVILDTNPDTVWADIKNNGYLIVEAQPSQLIVTHKIVDSVATDTANLSVSRQFTVGDGQMEFTT